MVIQTRKLVQTIARSGRNTNHVTFVSHSTPTGKKHEVNKSMATWLSHSESMLIKFLFYREKNEANKSMATWLSHSEPMLIKLLFIVNEFES